MMQTTELPAGNAVTVQYGGTEIRAMARTLYRNNVPPEMDRWARKRARAIAVQNALAARKRKRRQRVWPALSECRTCFGRELNLECALTGL